MKLCDLHAHSTFSDGTLTPEQLIQLAEQTGLAAVVLSDHNTVVGLPRFVAAGEGSSVEAVPGVEFSVDYGQQELHILMLFVKPEDYGPITQLLEQARLAKQQSTEALVAALQAAGFAVDYERLLSQAPDGYINRAHIAAELTRLGHAASVQEAFKTYLKPGGGYYTPPKRPDAFETIRFIKRLGGVAVLAHPFLNLQEQELTEFLPLAVKSGLDAMETMYSKYDAATTQTAKELAKRFGLMESGGSDFHGQVKPDIRLGTGRGDLQIPLELLEQLKTRKKDKSR